MKKLYGDGVHDDTEAIQELLNENVEVSLPAPQRYYLISKALEIPSRTRLILPRFAEIRLAPMSDCPMIKNVTVDEKQEICSMEIYEFVNRYSSKAEARAEQIEIIGGIWNYDNQNQRPNPLRTGDYGPNGDYNGIPFLFFHVKHLRLSSLTIKNPITYGAILDRVDYFTVDNITFDYNYGNPYPQNMDGIHLNGNCSFGVIRNLQGTCYDDLVALNADEGSCGAIKNIEIDGIFSENCHSAVRCLTAGCELKNVHISNVFGTYFQYCIGLTKYYESETPGIYDGISIDHIYASKAERFPIYHKDQDPIYPLIYIEGGSRIKNVTISDLYREEKINPVETIYVGKNTVIEHLILNNIKTENLTKADRMPLFVCEGTVNRLSCSDLTEDQKEITPVLGE